MSTEQAWAAGFFDGEGCSSVCHRREFRGRKARTQLILAVTQAGPEALLHLNRFRDAVGCGTTGLMKHAQSHQLAQYRWQIGSITGGLQAMRQLWPFLGPTKKRQFIKALRESARDFRLRKAA